MSIITLDEYKTYAGISNPAGDDKLQMLVDYANSLISEYCATSFESRSEVDKRQSITGTEVVLDHAPVLSVDEVRIMQGRNVLSVIDPLDIYLEPEQGIFTITSGITFPSTALNISVDYTHGYSEVPHTVKVSAYELVTHLSKREFNKSRNLGNGETAAYSDPTILPPHIRTGLDLYRVL